MSQQKKEAWCKTCI